MPYQHINRGVRSTGDFFTSFGAAENPISQGGIWQRGGVEGLDWNNPQSTANGAFAGAQTSVSFDDSNAHLKTSYRAFNARQFCRGTVYYDGLNDGTMELELFVRHTITAHSVTGYECYWSLNFGLNIVRWNGAIGDFTPLVSDGPFVPADGDLLEFRADGDLLTAYINGTLRLSTNDATWATGQPGMGFGPYPGVTTLTSYGWKNWRAGNLP